MMMTMFMTHIVLCFGLVDQKMKFNNKKLDVAVMSA